MLNKILLISFFFLSAQVVEAQDKGISFKQNLNWQQILTKAKAENKFVFVDCFATWCAPCKEMDRLTYPDEKVGDFFNAHFLSVKIQMDTSKMDDQYTIAWYGDAHQFLQQYVPLNGTISYPTFLFFSPEGKLLHRFFGFLDPQALTTLGKEAMDPSLQYYTLLFAYRKHQLADSLKPAFAIRAKLLGQVKLADSLGKDYVSNYLLTLPDRNRYTKSNMAMLDQFTHKTTDPGFEFIKQHSHEVDSVIGDHYYSDRKRIVVIAASEVAPMTKNRRLNTVAWKNMEFIFEKKYGFHGKMAVLQQRLVYTWNQKDWCAFEKAYMAYFKKIGPLNVIEVNNACWDIFLHSNNSEVLRYAIRVMNPHKTEDFECRDTYGNLLYKAGKRTAAIAWEKDLVSRDADYAAKAGVDPQEAFKITLEKMKKGVRTW